MVDKLIEEINGALDHELYYAALTLALTLPDICGKAKYQINNNKTRYTAWYDEHVGQYEQHPCDKPLQMPYLNAEIVYSLRCNVLHQGTPNIDKDTDDIDHFELLIEKKKEPEIYTDRSAITEDYRNGEIIGKQERHLSVNVRRLCAILCASANRFYLDNREKFNFFDYSIIDKDEEIEHLKSLGWI